MCVGVGVGVDVGSDFPRIIPFRYSNGTYCAKPTRFRSGWPGKFLAGSKPVCNNHRARFWQNATAPLSVSHFQTRLRSSADRPDHTVQNRPGYDLVLADCVRF